MEIVGNSDSALALIEKVLTHRVGIVHAKLALMEAEVAAQSTERAHLSGASEFVIQSRKEKDFSKNRQKAVLLICRFFGSHIFSLENCEQT